MINSTESRNNYLRFSPLILLFLWFLSLPLVYVHSLDFWVSPLNGSDSNDGKSPTNAFKTLSHVQQVISSLAPPRGRVQVHLQGGRYFLRSPMKFTPQDSSVSWLNVENQELPKISGGIEIKNWKPYQNGIWMASMTGIKGTQSRHLYVNGRRCKRTVYPTNPFSHSTQITNTYYEIQSSEPKNWKNLDTVELVYTQGGSPWTESRCTLDHLSSNGNSLLVYPKQPCFYNLRNKPCGQGASSPSYVENVGVEYIHQSGEWYFDVAADLVYYMPFANESMNQAEVIMPVLEKLIDAQGTVQDYVQNITFKGIVFEHATWLQPSQNEGYVEQQSGALIMGTKPITCEDDSFWRATHGNLDFNHSRYIIFDSCVFHHLGMSGVYFGGGSQYNIIMNSYFTDISGTSCQIGDYDTLNITDPVWQERNNTFFNNLVLEVAIEYHGNVGIGAGYTKGTSIVHNELGYLTYAGISIGWGWSRHLHTYASDQMITYNYIHDYKTGLLNDGGGIYALGPQPNSIMRYNYIINQTTDTGGALYPDEGSAYWDLSFNVVSGMCSSCEWLHIWTNSIHDIKVHDNFMSTSVYEDHGTNCPTYNNTLVKDGKWPPEAVSIMKNAGIIKHLFPFESASSMNIRIF